MKLHDIVTVYPVGKPEQHARARVLIVSGNQKAVALGFKDKPAFLSPRCGIFVGPEGILVLAARDHLADPWTDMVTDTDLVIIEETTEEATTV